MGSHCSGQLGVEGGSTGVRSGVHFYPHVTDGTTADSNAILARYEGGVTVGGLGTETKTGYRSGLPPLQGGLLVNILSCTKEDQRLETYSQSQTVEQVYQTNEIQNGDSCVSASLPYQEQMGSVARPEGRLPSCADSLSRPAMVAVSGPRSDIRVCMPTVRAIHCSPGVYTRGSSGGCLPQTEGSQPLYISGRLADLRRFVSVNDAPYQAGCPSSTAVGVRGQRTQVELCSDATPFISGGAARPGQGKSCAFSTEKGQPGSLRSNPERGEQGSSGSVAEGARTNGQYGRFSSAVSVPHATNTDTPSGLLQTTHRPVIQTCPHVGYYQGRAELVGQPRQLVSGDGISTSTLHARRDDGCVQDRLGRPSVGSSSIRRMDACRNDVPHKSPGTLGCREDSQCFPGEFDWSSCGSAIRQFDRCIVHQPRGRNTLSHSVSSHPQAVTVVSSTRGRVESDTYSRENEHPGGRIVTGLDANRMVSGPTHSTNDICENVLSNDRSVRNQSQQTVACLLHEVSRSQGICDRCSINRLDRNDGLRLPPSLSVTEGSREDREGGLPRSSDRSVLAETPVVSTASGPTCRTPDPSTSESRTSAGGRSVRKGKRSRSSGRAPPVDCMEVIRQRFRAGGFSDRAATLIASGRRDATLETYSQRLAPYYEWCRERDISPTRAAIAQVADFLSEKFDSGLKSNTVRNYKSAILAIHRGFANGATLNDGGHLALLLDGMFNARPTQRVSVPPWNLDTVLDYLKGRPFEPMRDATLKYVTLKTAFLVTLASGRRCSEIHALSASSTVFSRTGVTLNLRPDFVAKNESATFQHSAIFLPKIAMGSSVREDKVWCPVRALSYYFNKTSTFRNDDQLFLTYAEPHGPASKRTLARWLVLLVSDSGAVEGRKAPTAHSTRSIAASWAFHRGISIKEICDTVSWKAPTTFTTVYYKNVMGSQARGDFARAVLQRDRPGSSHAN